MSSPTCHYCERPGAFDVLVRTTATEQQAELRQMLCEVHDAIVANLRSVVVLDRRRARTFEPGDERGVVISLASGGRDQTRWTGAGPPPSPRSRSGTGRGLLGALRSRR